MRATFRLPLRSLFLAPTVATLAAHLRRAGTPTTGGWDDPEREADR